MMRTGARPFVVCRVRQMLRRSRGVVVGGGVLSTEMLKSPTITAESAPQQVPDSTCFFYNAPAASVTPNACSLADKWTRTKYVLEKDTRCSARGQANPKRMIKLMLMRQRRRLQKCFFFLLPIFDLPRGSQIK